MATRASHRSSSWRSQVARHLWVVIPLAVAWAAYRNRDAIVRAASLIGRANWSWLGAAALAIGGVYLCRARVYAVPLRPLGYDAPLPFLWTTAVAATSLHQLLPAAGATGYAFLTYAFRQRGVPTGQASLVALVDTLSYAVALATIVVGSLIYLAVGGVLEVGRLAIVFAPGAAVVALAAWVYRAQRDRRRFVPIVLRWKTRVASLLGARWPDEPVRAFLHDYYEGKRLIGCRRRAFYEMIGLQYLAVICDAIALYLSFVAIGVMPNIVTALIGFVLSMSGAAVVGAPAGGGGFEAIMAAFWARHGVDAAHGIAAAVLYRLVAFWLPVGMTLIILWRLRRRRRQIARAAGT